MKKLIVFIIILISISVKAQVPGYFGKRLSFGYSNYFSPSNFSIASHTTKDHAWGLNTSHSFNSEFTIKPRTNLCIGVQFSKLGIEDHYEYENYYSLVYQPASHKPMQLRTTNFSLGFKIFRSVYVAPVGKYQKIEFIFLLDEVKYNQGDFYDNISFTKNRVENIGKGKYNYRSSVFAYTIGRQRILFNSIIIDSGVRFGMSPNVMFDNIGDLFSSGAPSFENQIRRKVNQRIFGAQMCNIHLGIGFIAF